MAGKSIVSRAEETRRWTDAQTTWAEISNSNLIEARVYWYGLRLSTLLVHKQIKLQARVYQHQGSLFIFILFTLLSTLLIFQA